MSSTMHLTIVRTYEADDPEFLGDELEVVMLVDGKETLRGDWYHNKIDSQIAGFQAALNHLGVAFTEEVVNRCEEIRDFYAGTLLDE